ncbi:TonB-dependent receptor plug domain-containing protein [Colwellia psychrerythraea]|uniref:TonB-dependent receptor plug n=1 Tax=Colwellia psychrerythraea TaxID=28229 RepID=A0A099KPI0_COLPS|nr:TonB-dependent receptor [Colwellia psychrerythraea]KGJ91543.1 TonB-dependent receptor plug [Colwellia psychrerythraea]
MRIFSPLYLALATIYPLVSTSVAFAEEAAAADDNTEVIEIRSLRQKLDQAGRLKDVIQQTEVLDAITIENKNALSLTAAINNEPGVNVSNECSMCGVKRIMLNGMKGEHTTILVDGLPTHTLISGFYAVDAIATTGVDRIEVARGAGASLIAPEAIGGTVNIITKEAYENTASFDIAKGSHDFTAMKAMATGISDDGKTGMTFIGQYDKQDQEDHDDNGVSEAPFIENFSFTSFITQDISDSSNVQIRISKVKSEIFGGPILGGQVDSIGAALAGYDKQASEHLFEDDDVRKQYLGKPWETTEWIDTSRDEAYVKYLTEVSDYTVAEFAVSYANHLQDSFYEGIDYQAEDTMWYARAKIDMELSDKHFITFGADTRHEEMRSSTEALEAVAAYQSDGFDYETTGIFFQDTWTPLEVLEVAIALRIDQITADFVDPEKVGTEVEETFIAPRLDLRYFHTDELTSRFSTGRGYRAPLSFFETDHGILDTELGYQIDINSLEESLSASYSLSYDTETVAITASLAHSSVDNLASLEETADGVPLLTQLEESASVTTFDITLGYNLTENFTVNIGLEKFNYDDAFKSSYAIAPVEERASIELQYEKDNLKVFWSTVWFGEKNLSDYGYEGYNKLNDASTVKTLVGKSFSMSDIKVQYQLTEHTKIYAGVSNIFEQTQIDDGDTPLFYDAEGGYDVAYIYGALHGREMYAGVEIKL